MYGAFYFPSELTFVDITNAFIRRSRKLDLGNWFLYHAGSYIVLVLTSYSTFQIRTTGSKHKDPGARAVSLSFNLYNRKILFNSSG